VRGEIHKFLVATLLSSLRPRVLVSPAARTSLTAQRAPGDLCVANGEAIACFPHGNDDSWASVSSVDTSVDKNLFQHREQTRHRAGTCLATTDI